MIEVSATVDNQNLKHSLSVAIKQPNISNIHTQELLDAMVNMYQNSTTSASYANISQTLNSLGTEFSSSVIANVFSQIALTNMQLYYDIIAAASAMVTAANETARADFIENIINISNAIITDNTDNAEKVNTEDSATEDTAEEADTVETSDE